MTTFILRRLLQSLVVLIVVSIIIFLVMRLLPGDPILLLLSQEQINFTSPEKIQALRHEFGLDKPMLMQYFDWVSNVLHGDLGVSIIYRRSVISSIAQSAPITLHIGLLAFITSVILGIPLGIISAVRRGQHMDTIATIIANVGITIPNFWLGIILIYVFALKLGWLPVFGYTSPLKDFVMSTKQIIMPVFCLCIFTIASAARQTRSSMLEVLRQDYIRTAWAKGNRERSVIFKHALKNALIPVVTLMGIQISHILGGSVLVETVFSIPGMGRLMVDAILNKDFAVVQGVILIITIVVLLTNLLVDVSYGWLDPRIRYG
jgi:peptide/nickel transport system permease protein